MNWVYPQEGLFEFCYIFTSLLFNLVPRAIPTFKVAGYSVTNLKPMVTIRNV